MTRDFIGRPPSRASGSLFDRIRGWPGFKAITSILAIAGSYLLVTTLLHAPSSPEHWSADLRTKYLSTRPPTQHERITLVYVTEKTLASYPYLSPTDRQLLADLVRAIDAAGPAVIGFDFIIDRATEPAKDDALIAALREAKAKVVVGAIDEPRAKGRVKSFQATYLERIRRPVGHIYFYAHHNPLVISDQVVRQMADPLDKHDHQASFAKQVLDAVGAYPEFKSTYISWLLEPRDGSETFQSLPAEQVLGRDGAQLPVKDMLKGKIVLIGGNFTDRDQHLLPLSVVGDARHPGLFIHAQIVAQALDGRSLAVLGFRWELALLAIAAALGYAMGRRMKQILLVLELGAALVLVLVAVTAFWVANLILPYTAILLAGFTGMFVGRYTKPSGPARPMATAGQAHA
jgi:CHASE2 domain-containing sensor protein